MEEGFYNTRFFDDRNDEEYIEE